MIPVQSQSALGRPISSRRLPVLCQAVQSQRSQPIRLVKTKASNVLRSASMVLGGIALTLVSAPAQARARLSNAAQRNLLASAVNYGICLYVVGRGLTDN